jgi:PadR family transcriptional regulator PadR
MAVGTARPSYQFKTPPPNQEHGATPAGVYLDILPRSNIIIVRMPTKKTDLLQGTLDLLILKTVAPGPLHGYGIAQRILITSKETLQVQQGSLYPALHRLERQGLLRSEWKESGNGPMAKMYALTAAGRKRFQEEMAAWQRYAGAVAMVLES